MKQTIFAVLILVLLVACGPTSVVPTPNPQVPPDDAFVVTTCSTIYSFKPWDVNFKGVAALGEYKTSSRLFLRNLENNNEIPLATVDDSALEIMVSPNRKTLAYQLGHPKTSAWNLVVADMHGSRKADFVWEKGFFITGHWINDQEILIHSDPAMTIFNPYTNQHRDFSFADFPGYSIDTKSNRTAIFDPTLERAIYKNEKGKVSLMDLTNKKILAEVDNRLNPSVVASWSPDGNQVAVAGTLVLGNDESDDIFSVSRDGNVKRLTHLVDHYGKLVNIGGAGLRWSPNGRSLAFWINYPQNMAAYWDLMVFDTSTQKTTNYCLTNYRDSSLNSIHQLPAPIWSPDGTQIMVEMRDDKGANKVLILDLATNTAYPIAENMYPGGWLVSGTGAP